MAVVRFTDSGVKSLAEGLYFDERTPGFGMLVGKRRKTWLVVKGKKRAYIRLGHYPSLSLSDARKRALVSIGSPLEQSEAPGFQEALERFLDTKKQSLRPLSLLPAQ